MSYRGDFALESTFDVKFTTRRFSTGAPFALASGVISAYVDNSTTQLTAGITLSADFDGVTGLNNVRVVATAANGYLSGSNYQLIITTGTVDSVSVVGEVIGEFSIQARSALRPTTAGVTLDVSATGEAGVDWANVGGKTTTNALTNTTVAVTQKVDIDTIKTNPVVNGGTITFPTTATLASTTNITAGTITTATNLTNAPTSGDLTATMKTSVTTAATAATPIAASVTGAVGSVTGNVGGNVVGSVASVTAGVTLAASAVQAIWDALTSALTTVGSIGKKLSDWTIGTAQTGDSFARLGAPAGASVSADIAAVKTDTAAIKLKTDNLPSDPADASDIAASFSTVNATLATIAAYIDTEVAAIKAKTDNLPAAPAAIGDIPTVSQIWTTALTEAYRSAGATGTGAQLMYEILQNLTEFSISSTTKTTKKLDGSTTAKTYTLNSASSPTSITETT